MCIYIYSDRRCKKCVWMLSLWKQLLRNLRQYWQNHITVDHKKISYGNTDQLLTIAFNGRLVLVLFNLLMLLRQSCVYRVFQEESLTLRGHFPQVKLLYFIQKYAYLKFNIYRVNAFFGLWGKLSIDEVTQCYYIKYQWLVGFVAGKINLLKQSDRLFE